jgi:DNA repair photolyase
VNVAPLIPALTDHEIPAILEAAYAAGACSAGYTVVRLPFSVKEVFSKWLEQYFPERKEKVLGRIRESQGRTLSHPEFGSRIRGVGVWAEHIAQVFRVSMIHSGMAQRRRPELSTAAFRRPAAGGQMELALD